MEHGIRSVRRELDSSAWVYILATGGVAGDGAAGTDPGWAAVAGDGVGDGLSGAFIGDTVGDTTAGTLGGSVPTGTLHGRRTTPITIGTPMGMRFNRATAQNLHRTSQTTRPRLGRISG